MKVLFWMFTGFDQHTTSEHLLVAILEQLCRAGHTVHIVQKGTGGPLPAIPRAVAACGVTTDVIPFRAAAKGNFAARYLRELQYVRDCKKVLRPGYDAVFIQSNNVAGFAVGAVRRVLAQARVTFNVQDIFPYNAAYSGSIRRNGVLFRVLAAVQRYGYRHADRIITISEDMKDTLVEDGTAASKIQVIYNWSYQDGVYEHRAQDAPAGMFDSRFFHVVYAGNIGVMQNVDILIEAARLLKDEQDVWFHIIGNGVYREKLQAKAKAYGITRLSFWPMQPPETAPAIYSAASVNVIPLVKDVYRTALPSKTATCLACRKPVIFAIGKASRFGQRVLREAGCAVVESDRPEELAAAIRQLRAAPQSGTDGAFFLENCSITKNSRRYAQTIAGGSETGGRETGTGERQNGA